MQLDCPTSFIGYDSQVFYSLSNCFNVMSSKVAVAIALSRNWVLIAGVSRSDVKLRSPDSKRLLGGRNL